MPEVVQVVEPIRDDTFGRLEWDAILHCWLGGINWPLGLYTEVAIWFPDNDPVTDFHQAHESLIWLQRHDEETRQTIAAEMVQVYNEAWRDESEPITAVEFACRIELVRIGFESDGSLLLSYDGHEMFGGHVIDGRFESDRSYGGATLVG
jgi:hypothetical protein